MTGVLYGELDVVSTSVFVWVIGQLFPWAVDPNDGILDSHLFLYDRFSDLADYHRLNGRTAKADRLAAVAQAYYQAAPDDDEPEAGCYGDAGPASPNQHECGEHYANAGIASGRPIRPGSIARALTCVTSKRCTSSTETERSHAADVTHQSGERSTTLRP